MYIRGHVLEISSDVPILGEPLSPTWGYAEAPDDAPKYSGFRCRSTRVYGPREEFVEEIRQAWAKYQQQVEDEKNSLLPAQTFYI